MRIAALVKQVPATEAMALRPDGRLRRDGLELEMNPYCRRAVAKGAELAAGSGGSLTILSLGPPSAEEAVREATAWALQHGAEATGVLITDPAFAGSDTLATARALAAALRCSGPFDLVLCGLNSVDSDTGQVGPQVAELLDLPFAAGVRQLDLHPDSVTVECRLDDGCQHLRLPLPALLSCAERLCEPSKVPIDARDVDARRIVRLRGADLGDGPWGADGSPTRVGVVRALPTSRLQRRLAGTVEDQVDAAVSLLVERDALHLGSNPPELPSLPAAGPRDCDGPQLCVLAEPGRASTTRELLNTAALLASEARGWVCAIGQAGDVDPATLASWGADEVIELHGSDGEEDVAQSISTYAEQTGPWAILAPSTAWGRHVAGRTAAWLGAGLTGDAVSVEVAGRRLVAWKPAFGGQLLAAIESRSPIQLVTVRPGALPVHADRRGVAPHVTPRRVASRGRVVVASRTRDDDLEVLATADHVVGVGLGVDPADYDLLQPLVAVLGAELGATRKVTDRGWLPRSRQIGITGRCVAPKLYVAVGISGRLNHTVGVRQAGTILAINADPDAEIIEHCDVAILADWRAVAPLLAARIGQVHRPASRPMPI